MDVDERNIQIMDVECCVNTVHTYSYLGKATVRVCVFIELHITAQSGPVILVILCHSY